MVRRKDSKKREVENYTHADKERVNNPPVGLVTPDTDKDAGKKTYAHDPHLDPQLVWAGKAEHTSFQVSTVSLHVHERIDPRTLVEAMRKRSGAPPQPSLFAGPEENPPIRQAIEFYQHRHNWSNRLIAGDSLLVMNSLLEKEGLGGQVQMVYIDPPYGIRYGSNFQPFVNQRDVTDGRDEDLTQEPEQIRAFRDTWELGIHSYLAYLRDRLLLARELLHESGSCFVQIGDENVHHVRELMDEVLGKGNFVAQIYFSTTGGFAASTLSRVGDYLVWYARDRTKIKYRQLFLEKSALETGDAAYKNVELANGSRRPMSKDERSGRKPIPAGSRIFRHGDLQSSGSASGDTPFEFDGEIFRPNRNNHWKATWPDGMTRLKAARRVDLVGNTLSYVRYVIDNPVNPLTNSWMDTSFAGFATDKKYVVETNPKVIQRCILMTTDPGDLVFDPTCGSGTTAYVAEQWGRRWITCDTSRVATALAKQRLMTASYHYYELAHPQEGVGSGFQYRTVPHITLKSIANNPDIREGMGRAEIEAAIARHAPQETLYDQPRIDRGKARITGPFTVEAVPAPAVKPLDEIVGRGEGIADSGEDAGRSSLSTNHFTLATAREGETLRQSDWRDELFKTGIRGKAGQRISFARLEPLAGTRWLHAEGETRPDYAGAERVVVSFGPEHAPLEQRQVAHAIEEAQNLVPKPKVIVFAAFQFDPEASKDIDETHWPGVTLLKAQMNADLLTDDLKKKRASNESFWLIGQPDVVVVSEQWLVNSKKEAIAPHDIVAELSGVDSLAKINGLGRDDLSLFVAIAERRDLWDALTVDAGGGVDSSQHRRGSGETWDRGVSSIPERCAGIPGRIGDVGDFMRELELLSETDRRSRLERLRRNREIADRTREIAASLTGPLSTVHYSQVTIHGFDYYNTKTGNVESGGADKIAMWMLDTDYDGRSLFPRQVFFLTAVGEDDLARLARNLKAEIDADLIAAYRGTDSLPFEAGEHSRIAVKIIDDRGIESLKVVETEP